MTRQAAMAEGYSKLRNELVSAANGAGYAYRDTGGGDGAARPRPGCHTEACGPIPAPAVCGSRSPISSALVRQPQPGDADTAVEDHLVHDIRGGQHGDDDASIAHLREDIQQAAMSQTASIEPLRPDDIADAVAYIVTRDRRMAVNEILVRAGEQTW